MRKGKGRICVDCTKPGPGEEGSINTYIDKPGVAPADECPSVYYGDTFMRFLIVVRWMRLTLLLHCDDIDAAFWRVLYHLDLAIAFAYVFLDYLIVPIGQVFGSRSAPSFFSLTSDIRAFVATTHNIPTEPLTPQQTLLSSHFPNHGIQRKTSSRLVLTLCTSRFHLTSTSVS
jgi:hypothetical protein